MKKTKEERKKIIRNTIIALGFLPTALPICEGGKILLKETTNISYQEIEDKLMEKSIEAMLYMPISFTTMGLVFQEEENEEKKLVK